MAKSKSNRHPVTGIELDDINFLGISIPNSYDNPLYAEDIDFAGFSLRTNIFSQSSYYIKLAMHIQIKLKIAESGQRENLEEDLNKKRTEEDAFNVTATAAAEFIFKVLSTSKRKDFELSKLPEELRHVAASVSYSTFRGMLYARAAGTMLDSFILPIAKTNEILQPLESANEQDTTLTE